MLLQIKKVAANKRVPTKKKSCITRQATWKLIPSFSIMLQRIKMGDNRSEKQIHVRQGNLPKTHDWNL